MSSTPLLEETLALALKLSPKERIQLIEQVASSVEREIENAQPDEEHWGRSLNALLDQRLGDWGVEE